MAAHTRIVAYVISIVYLCNEHFSETKKLEELNSQIQLAIQGKQNAYRYLLDKYWDDIYRFQKSRINNQNDAEDITIQTFAKAFDYLKQYNQNYDFKNWLLMISKQIYIDFQRKKKQNIESIKDSKDAFQLVDKEISAEDKIILEQNLLQLKSAINKLKPHYKEVIELRYFYDFSYKEIAQKIDEPLNNVKIKLLRAKKLLSDMLEERGKR
jgi:RNA polymerase sigma-70 factor (ECF subfamily)